MPAADCRFLHHGRIMRCLTYLLLLPETLKKSRKAARLPLCYELLAVSLTSRKRQKMAAELYPASTTSSSLSSGTTLADADKTKAVQVKQAAGGGGGCGGGTATTPTTQQNITNNNVEPPSWQCSHPTLRERYHRRGETLPPTPCRLVIIHQIWGGGVGGGDIKVIWGQQHQNGRTVV